MKTLILFYVVLFLGHAFASGAGNGGDAVVCRDKNDKIFSAELLDFYEAKKLRNIIPKVVSPEKSFEENLESLFDTLATISPVRARIYRGWYETFESEANRLRDTTLIDIPDSGHLAFRNGCKVEQVVIQQEPLYPEDKIFLINEDIWDELPSDSQAGLILHELILKETIITSKKIGNKTPINSLDVRYFNSLIASEKIAEYSLKEFNELISSFTFLKYLEIDGFSEIVDVKASDLRYSQDGKSVEYTTLYFDNKYFLNNYPHPVFYENVKIVNSYKRDRGSSYYPKLSLSQSDGEITLEQWGFYLFQDNQHVIIDRNLVKDYKNAIYFSKILIKNDELTIYTPNAWQDVNLEKTIGLSNPYGCMIYSMSSYSMNVASVIDMKEKYLKKIILPKGESLRTCGLRYYSYSEDELQINFSPKGFPLTPAYIERTYGANI